MTSLWVGGWEAPPEPPPTRLPPLLLRGASIAGPASLPSVHAAHAAHAACRGARCGVWQAAPPTPGAWRGAAQGRQGLVCIWPLLLQPRLAACCVLAAPAGAAALGGRSRGGCCNRPKVVCCCWRTGLTPGDARARLPRTLNPPPGHPPSALAARRGQGVFVFFCLLICPSPWPPPLAQVMHAIKQAIDPLCIMNPGKLGGDPATFGSAAH